MKLSVALIVKNEKDHIETVLRSVQGADEIVVCDTGSIDNTVELAKQFTDKVFIDYVWNDDFAEARNHALSKCTGDWILSIDADEYLEEGGIKKIRELLQSVKNEKTFSVIMKAEGTGNPHFLARLFKNDGSVKWVGKIHETLSPREDNKVNIVITYGYSTAHKLDPELDLRILLGEVLKNPNSPREKYYLAREYFYKKDYIRAIWWFEEYVQKSTWNAEKADAYLYLARCYFQLSKGDIARKMCLQAIFLNPDFKEALYFMAELHYEPMKSQWLKYAEIATNTGVLFTRHTVKPTNKPLDMSDIDILYFKNVLAAHQNIDVLEWGSGNSTKYFTEWMSKQGIKYSWDSIEHDKAWYEAVKKWNLPNVQMLYAEKGSDEYFNLPNRKYDVIFIDGRNRRKCLIKAKELLKPGGIVLLHDGDREYYHSGFDGYHWKFVDPIKHTLPRLWVGKLEPFSSRIPKIIHQIWLGPKQPPTEWMNTWKEKHPDWKYQLWTEKEIDSFGLVNKAVYDKYYAEKCFNGCANIARTEILIRFGGVYIDADSICETTMENAPFMDWDIFSIYEADDFFVDSVRLVANGIIGCIPNHPVLNRYRDQQSQITEIMPSWRKSGPVPWTKVMTIEHGILPPFTFLPEHHSGIKNKIDGTVYSRQFWGTSKNLYQ